MNVAPFVVTHSSFFFLFFYFFRFALSFWCLSGLSRLFAHIEGRMKYSSTTRLSCLSLSLAVTVHPFFFVLHCRSHLSTPAYSCPFLRWSQWCWCLCSLLRNSIGDAGVAALAAGLRENSSLTKLTLVLHRCATDSALRSLIRLFLLNSVCVHVVSFHDTLGSRE